MANYRQMYKQYYGINFGREYHVHHIDCNHENDAIGNLVLLPRNCTIDIIFKKESLNRRICPH